MHDTLQAPIVLVVCNFSIVFAGTVDAQQSLTNMALVSTIVEHSQCKIRNRTESMLFLLTVLFAVD
jgi:hypothetical protein